MTRTVGWFDDYLWIINIHHSFPETWMIVIILTVTATQLLQPEPRGEKMGCICWTGPSTMGLVPPAGGTVDR